MDGCEINVVVSCHGTYPHHVGIDVATGITGGA